MSEEMERKFEQNQQIRRLLEDAELAKKFEATRKKIMRQRFWSFLLNVASGVCAVLAALMFAFGNIPLGVIGVLASFGGAAASWINDKEIAIFVIEK